MTETSRPGRAARRHLARLVAVLAVLAGLAVSHGLQCADGMVTAMPVAHTSAPNAEAHVEDGPMLAAQLGAAAATPADSHQPDPADLGGVLAACLTLVVAVVVVIAGLLPGRVRCRVVSPATVVAALVRAAAPRSLSLAELCLLRT